MINVIEFITTGMGDGGAETIVKDYALLLDKSKYRVVIVTIGKLDLSSANYNRLQQAGVEMISLDEGRRIRKSWIARKIWNRFFYKHYLGRRLFEILKKENARVLHCHLEVLYVVETVAKKIKGLNLFFTCHSRPDIIFKPTRWESEEKAARYLINNNHLQMIALHDEMRQELNKRFGIDDTLVIHNGIDFNKFLSVKESSTSIRRSINIPESKYVVGHVGRFSEPKNHLYLVEIFAEILRREPNAHLLMVGSGELRPMIEKRMKSLGIDGKYTILSHRTDIPRLLKAMDVFVFPSIYEGLPVSVVEAQVAGLRVIASDVITKECFFSEDAVPLSIGESPSLWADAVLNRSIKGPYDNRIDAFDMNKEIIRLGQLYERNPREY